MHPVIKRGFESLIPRPVHSWSVTRKWMKKHPGQVPPQWFGIDLSVKLAPVVLSMHFLDNDQVPCKRIATVMEGGLVILNFLTDQHMTWPFKVDLKNLQGESLADLIGNTVGEAIKEAVPFFERLRDGVEMEST